MGTPDNVVQNLNISYSQKKSDVSHRTAVNVPSGLIIASILNEILDVLRIRVCTVL
jgi:hypothetical protein